MKIWGFEIKKIKDYPLPKTKDFEDFITDCHTKCLNQLRGNINDKAKEYNSEILEYYISQIMEQSINFGIQIEKDLDHNEKLSK